MHRNIGFKCNRTSENSTYLFHKPSDHISEERLERLVNGGNLQNLDFTDLGYVLIALRESKLNTVSKEPKKHTLLQIRHL